MRERYRRGRCHYLLGFSRRQVLTSRTLSPYACTFRSCSASRLVCDLQALTTSFGFGLRGFEAERHVKHHSMEERSSHRRECMASLSAFPIHRHISSQPPFQGSRIYRHSSGGSAQPRKLRRYHLNFVSRSFPRGTDSAMRHRRFR